MIKTITSIKLLALSAFFVILYYFTSLNYSFSQDDFIHLSASNAKNITDILNFFNPYKSYPDIFFFRPLSTQLWFFLNNFLFGYNSFPYHIEILTIHILNSYLFYLLIQKLYRDEKVAILAMIFYAVSAIHFLNFYYISAFQQVLRFFFILLSLLSYLKFLDTKKKSSFIFSLVFFFGSLLSKETSIIYPLLLLPITFLYHYQSSIIQNIEKKWVYIAPFIAIAIIYIAFRLAGIQVLFNEGSYQTTFDLSNISQNLKWYILWSIGLPEIISTLPSLTPSTLLNFSNSFPFARFILFSTIIFLISLVILINKKLFDKKLIINLMIFIIPLLPVLILDQHRYPHYLDLSTIAIFPPLAMLISQFKKNLKPIAFISFVTFLLLQFYSIKLSDQTHWTTHRSQVVQIYYQFFQKNHPTIAPDTSIIFVGTPQSTNELSIALAKDYALKIWYPTLKEVLYLTSPSEYTNIQRPLVIPITDF